eukprot:5427141-Amphidinium_carterae.1
MRAASRRLTGKLTLPMPRFSPLSAPGPSGERQEHLEDIMSAATHSTRRKFFKALDTLTVLWAVGSLPQACS